MIGNNHKKLSIHNEHEFWGEGPRLCAIKKIFGCMYYHCMMTIGDS